MEEDQPELMSRADFYAELVVLKDHIHTGHLAILEKLDANHRELLAALDRQASCINTLEAGLAQVDERTKQGRRLACPGRGRQAGRLPYAFGACYLAGTAGHARRFNKQNNKRKQVTYENIRHPTVR